MDARIDALELEMRDTRAAMARIDLALVRIEERMATKADLAALALSTKTDISAVAERVAKVEGMVEKLPTTLQLLGFIVALVFTVMGGAFGIVRLLHP